MKLAIEHIQSAIAKAERDLSDNRNGLSAITQQLADQTSVVARNENVLKDLRSALALLRAPVPGMPAPAIVDQIVKTELNGKKQAPLALKAKN